MGRVAVLYKVFPKENELETALANIKKKLKPASIETQELAFGIKVIRVLFTFNDSDASSSRIEEQLKSIEGVSEVEVEEESLV
jgi:translation elongation factor EF-1beta